MVIIVAAAVGCAGDKRNVLRHGLWIFSSNTSLTQTVLTTSLGHTRILKCVIYCAGIPLSYANSTTPSLAHNPIRTFVTHNIDVNFSLVLAGQNMELVPLPAKELLTMDVYFDIY